MPMYYRVHIDEVTGRRGRPSHVETVALPAAATTSRCEGWFKNFLRRRRLVGPGIHAFDVHARELLALCRSWPE